MMGVVVLALTYTELVAMLESDADPVHREAAAQILGRERQEGAVPALLKRAQSDGNPWVRARAAEALGRIGDPAVTPSLHAQLELEHEEQVRFRVAAALARLGDRAGVDELLRLMRVGSNHVKAHAMEFFQDWTGRPLGMDAAAWSDFFARDGARYAAGAPARTAVVDLTHVLAAGIPMWPGADPPAITKISGYEQVFLENRVALVEHSGTHLDAPAHIAPGTPTVDALAPDTLRAPAAVIDVRDKAASDADYRVSIADLTTWESQHGRIPRGGVVIAWTGWSDRWSDPARYRNADAKGVMHFPGFSLDAADWLIRERGELAGVGIDTLSIDPGVSTDFAAHKRVLGARKYAIENLASLDRLPARGATLWVAPLPIAGGSGAPARVLAEVE